MNLSNTMSKMTRLGFQHAGALAVSAAAWISTAAYAVNDLPGGPAVNQLNLHPAATRIAEEQQWLHWFMMAICLVIFVAVFGVMLLKVAESLLISATGRLSSTVACLSERGGILG